MHAIEIMVRGCSRSVKMAPFINCSLVRFLCCDLVVFGFAGVYQVSGWEVCHCLCHPTYNVSSGMLNATILAFLA